MKPLKINAEAFTSTLKANEALPPQEMLEPPAEVGFGQAMEPPSESATGARVAVTTPRCEPVEAAAATAAAVPLLTRPVSIASASTGQAPAPSEVAKPAEAVAPASRTKPIWSRLRRPAAVEERESPAKRPNPQRGWMIVAGVFLVGLVLGPWLGSKAVPDPAPAQGPAQSAAAIADTLKASALGLPVPALPPASAPAAPSLGDASPPVSAQGVTRPAATGEKRYLDMLESLKAQGGDQKSIQVVPKIEGSAPVRASVSREPAQGAPQKPAYPDSPIPLEIERDGAAFRSRDSAPQQAASAPLAGGAYIVVRVAQNADGRPAALMMPLGGRAADAYWLFVGDATVDGFEVAAITSARVLLRTSTGRLVQLVPQS